LFSYCTMYFYSLICSYGPCYPYSCCGRRGCGRRGGGALLVLISLSLLRSGFLGVVLVGWRGAGGEREEVGRGCTTPSQRVLQNHKRRFCFLQRIQLVRPCTTALQLASRIRPLIEYESSPGTLAIVAPRGATWLVSAGAVMPPIGAVRGGGGGSRTCRWTVSEPCWPRTVALKCEYAIYTDSVDTEEKRGRIWPSTAISDVLAPIWKPPG